VHIEVVDVRSHPEGFEVVLFRHPNCLARGRWKSRHRAERGQTYSVELDLKDPIGMLQPADAGSRDLGIHMDSGDEDVLLCGILEAVDDDGVGFIRVSRDCLFMCETSPGWTEPGRRIVLTIRPEDLLISPQGG
jgi:hypothetical protein